MRMSRLSKLTVSALGALAMLGLSGTAQATPIISVTPTPITVQSGLSQNFTVAVSNLAAADEVGGVSLQLSWNGGLLTPGSYTLDPNAKMGTALDPSNVDPSTGFSGGNTLVLSFLADLSLNSAALHALQGNGFTLATFSLTGAALGVTPINLNVYSPAGPNGVALSDGDGNALPATLNGACVTVARSNTEPTQACQTVVPEPGSVALMGTGLGMALMAIRRRRSQANG